MAMTTRRTGKNHVLWPLLWQQCRKMPPFGGMDLCALSGYAKKGHFLLKMGGSWFHPPTRHNSFERADDKFGPRFGHTILPLNEHGPMMNTRGRKRDKDLIWMLVNCAFHVAQPHSLHGNTFRPHLLHGMTSLKCCCHLTASMMAINEFNQAMKNREHFVPFFRRYNELLWLCLSNFLSILIDCSYVIMRQYLYST